MQKLAMIKQEASTRSGSLSSMEATSFLSLGQVVPFEGHQTNDSTCGGNVAKTAYSFFGTSSSGFRATAADSSTTIRRGIKPKHLSRFRQLNVRKLDDGHCPA